MKIKIFSFFALAMIAFSACNNDADLSTDAALIQAIQEADDKMVVSEDALPASTATLLADEYTESYLEDAQLAPKLGYQVRMRRGEGTLIGERSEVYFDMNGRELRQERDQKRDRGECGRDRKECFTMVFPVTFTMPDGSEISGENKMEVRTAIKAWYEANPGVEEKPALQFPVEIEYEDGSVVTLENAEELRAAFRECRGDKMRNKCFDWVYPVTFIMPDGSTITGDSKEEIGGAIRAWYQANPGVHEKATLQFPVDIVYEDETTATVNNATELREAFRECE